MKGQFHIGRDGRPRPCHAQHSCPLGGEGSHFSSAEEAEQHMEKNSNMLSSASKSGASANSPANATERAQSYFDNSSSNGEVPTRENAQDFLNGVSTLAYTDKQVEYVTTPYGKFSVVADREGNSVVLERLTYSDGREVGDNDVTEFETQYDDVTHTSNVLRMRTAMSGYISSEKVYNNARREVMSQRHSPALASYYALSGLSRSDKKQLMEENRQAIQDYSNNQVEYMFSVIHNKDDSAPTPEQEADHARDKALNAKRVVENHILKGNKTKFVSSRQADLMSEAQLTGVHRTLVKEKQEAAAAAEAARDNYEYIKSQVEAGSQEFSDEDVEVADMARGNTEAEVHDKTVALKNVDIALKPYRDGDYSKDTEREIQEVERSVAELSARGDKAEARELKKHLKKLKEERAALLAMPRNDERYRRLQEKDGAMKNADIRTQRAHAYEKSKLATSLYQDAKKTLTHNPHEVEWRKKIMEQEKANLDKYTKRLQDSYSDNNDGNDNN